MNRYVVLAAALALSLLVVAGLFALRTDDQASSAGLVPSVPATTTSAKPALPAAVPNASESVSAAATPTLQLRDGRHFGYIESIDLATSPATLQFDLAYLLKGDEANREAARRGYPTPVDNDYFIVNDNPRLRTLPLAQPVKIRLLDWKRCCDTFLTANLERFAASFERRQYPAGNYRGKFSAYELSVEDGVVVEIDEHYFP
jgi:hypothetical protein